MPILARLPLWRKGSDNKVQCICLHYADPRAKLEHPASVEWVHSTAEVVSALGAAGLRTEFLHEHDWIWYRLLPVLTQGQDGRWRTPDGAPRFPLLYSLRAAKDS